MEKSAWDMLSKINGESGKWGSRTMEGWEELKKETCKKYCPFEHGLYGLNTEGENSCANGSCRFKDDKIIDIIRDSDEPHDLCRECWLTPINQNSGAKKDKVFFSFTKGISNKEEE